LSQKRCKYRTVKKYIEKEDFNETRHRSDRPNRTDSLRPVIEKWLIEDQSRHRKQRHTAKRIFDRLKDEYPQLLAVSERTVRNVVREERQKLYGEKDAHLQLNHPGGEAQADFGSFEAKEDGRLKQFYELVLSYPKSNAGFAVVTRSETREALLEGLTRIFRFCGYVPRSIWFDQMSAAALRSRDEKGKVKILQPGQRSRKRQCGEQDRDHPQESVCSGTCDQEPGNI
jgi:transposase